MAGEDGVTGTGDGVVRDDVQDEDRDDQVDGEHDDGDDSGEQDGDDEYTPPSREEWAKLRRVVDRRRDERNKARAERDALKAQLAERDKPKADAGKDDGAGRDDDQDRQQDDRFRAAAARASAATQLQAAGFAGTAKQAKRLAGGLLDLNAVEPDDDGDFDFEEAIDELKEEYPQLFQRPATEEERKPPVRRPTVADRGRRTERDATSDPSERTSARMRRAAGLPVR